MKKLGFIIIILQSLLFFSQENNIHKIDWSGAKKMNIKFMTKFIQSKENEALDSLKLNHDVQALTRLNGISKVTYTVEKDSVSNHYNITFKIIENFSIIPNSSLWTTDETPAAYRVGLYEFNLLGKNNVIGGFYQFNGISSFGFNFSSPFLFNENLGIETSYQNLGSVEPIFFDATTARYEYINRSFELLGVYRTSFKNTIKLGGNIFNEKYQYKSGATSERIPLRYSIDKILFKLNNNYDNLKYDFYLIDGTKNTTNLQFVTQSNSFQEKFLIGWNDFSYFKRIGGTGNWATRIRLGLSSNNTSPFSPFSLDNNVNIRGVGNIIDRGTGTFVVNTEYRTTLFEKKWFVLQGNSFIDIGSWRKPGGDFSDFTKSENFKVYPGIGLRFMHKTIFNAIFRLDYGFGISKNGTRGLVFGIGQYF